MGKLWALSLRLHVYLRYTWKEDLAWDRDGSTKTKQDNSWYTLMIQDVTGNGGVCEFLRFKNISYYMTDMGCHATQVEFQNCQWHQFIISHSTTIYNSSLIKSRSSSSGTISLFRVINVFKHKRYKLLHFLIRTDWC